MSEPFISEIRLMSFVFAPKGWALCDGQLLPINQNQALFSLLGTNFGGDGRVNFGLPDLRGRTPFSFGNNHVLGERGGAVSHTLTSTEIPPHIHQLSAFKGVASVAVPGPTTTLAGQSANPFGKSASPLAGPATTNIGGNQAHENRQPYLTLSYCIALQGIFPSPN